MPPSPFTSCTPQATVALLTCYLDNSWIECPDRFIRGSSRTQPADIVVTCSFFCRHLVTLAGLRLALQYLPGHHNPLQLAAA